MKKVMLVFGTRPEAIKLCPLVNELRKSDLLRPAVCVTGQHGEMLRQALDIFGVTPDHDLGLMRQGQELGDLTAAALAALRDVYAEEKPDMVLVQGDTTTAFAAALAAFYQKIPVGHVEAGLRTGDLYAPYPEEFNRRGIGVIAGLHFAPTETARENLLREGKDPAGIFVTGNTGIDALRFLAEREVADPVLTWAEGSRLLTVTAHRRESLGAPMRAMFRGIRRIAEEFPDVKVVCPVHPNPAVREAARQELAGCGRILMTEPMPADVFQRLMAGSFLILTDSGGIQEEATALGKPTLVMRDATERPEGLETGTLRLVGASEEGIYAACRELLTDGGAYRRMCRAEAGANPYGDGQASARIRAVLEEWSRENN